MVLSQDLDWAEDKIAHLVYLLANPGLDLFGTTQDILDQIEYHKLDCHQVVFGQSIFQAAIAEDNLMVVQWIWSKQPPVPLPPLAEGYQLVQLNPLTQPEGLAAVKSVVNQAFRWTALTVLGWLIKLLNKPGFTEIINQVLEDNLVELRDNILSFHLVVSNVKLSNHIQHLIAKQTSQAELWDTPSQVLNSLVLLQGYHFADTKQSYQDYDGDNGDNGHDKDKYQFVDTPETVDGNATKAVNDCGDFDNFDNFEEPNLTQSQTSQVD